MSDNEWKWYAGRDEEFFDVGPCDTREQAIYEGHDSHEDGFHIVEAIPGRLWFSAKRMIEEQYFEADDLFDFDHSEPDRKGPADEADAELQAAIDAWTAKWAHTFVMPTTFRASRNGEYVPAKYVADGPLSEDEQAELAALHERAGDLSIDDMSRRYVLQARADHFAESPAS